jgi:5-enolpyruvylshikimate-3-phosphate synthase
MHRPGLTAAVLALFAGGPCRLSGLGHLRYKESDRLAVLASNLLGLGAEASVEGGALAIEAPARGALHGARIDTANDHRIAMAFGVAGLAIPGVMIDDPAVVAKSYPRYWEDAERVVRTEAEPHVDGGNDDVARDVRRHGAERELRPVGGIDSFSGSKIVSR